MARAVQYGNRADTALLLVCAVLALIVRALPAERRDPFASGMRRSVVAPLVTLQKRAELVRSAWLSYEVRTHRLDSLALQAMEARALSAENGRLRALLGLGQRLSWGFVPAEALHNRSLGEEFTLTLTAGTNTGVRQFSPVIAPEGLVGMVHTVDPSMSMAILWSHPDFRVSAMSIDGSAFGIVSARLGGGPERYLMELRGVPFRNELKKGSLIVSSGLGGVYPRGIPIGTVLSEVNTPEGWARTYLLRPAVLPPDVNSIMILTPGRAAAGVESIWAGVADSARLAAAADSIVRTDSVGRPDTAGRDTTRRAAPPAAAPGAAPAATPTRTPASGDTTRRTPPAARPTAPRPVTTPPVTGAPVVRPPTPAAPRRDTGATGRPDTARPTPPPARDTARPTPVTPITPIPPTPGAETSPAPTGGAPTGGAPSGGAPTPEVRS